MATIVYAAGYWDDMTFSVQSVFSDKRAALDEAAKHGDDGAVETFVLDEPGNEANSKFVEVDVIDAINADVKLYEHLLVKG